MYMYNCTLYIHYYVHLQCCLHTIFGWKYICNKRRKTSTQYYPLCTNACWYVPTPDVILYFHIFKYFSLFLLYIGIGTVHIYSDCFFNFCLPQNRMYDDDVDDDDGTTNQKYNIVPSITYNSKNTKPTSMTMT